MGNLRNRCDELQSLRKKNLRRFRAIHLLTTTTIPAFTTLMSKKGFTARPVAASSWALRAPRGRALARSNAAGGGLRRGTGARLARLAARAGRVLRIQCLGWPGRPDTGLIAKKASRSAPGRAPDSGAPGPLRWRASEGREGAICDEAAAGMGGSRRRVRRPAACVHDCGWPRHAASSGTRRLAARRSPALASNVGPPR